MENKMTYEEYREEVVKQFLETTDKYYEKEDIEKYIVEYEKEIKKGYLTNTELIKIGRRKWYDISGFVYGMSFEF